MFIFGYVCGIATVTLVWVVYHNRAQAAAAVKAEADKVVADVKAKV